MLGQSILLVDDEELLRLSLQVNMEREGFAVDTAESGEEALTALQDCPYSLLLTDYLMVGISGIELMQQAKSLHPGIKVIVFSGYEDLDLTHEIRRLGADDFFCKPIDFDDLLERTDCKCAEIVSKNSPRGYRMSLFARFV